MRTREVWIHAVDLDNGGRFDDFPDIVLESLLTDIVGTWRRKRRGRDLMIEVTGAAPVIVGDRVIDPRVVRGPLAGVVRWAAGRGTNGVSANGTVPPPPPWL